MTQSYLGRAGGAYYKPRVMGDTLARPESQAKAGLEIDKYNRPVLELLTHYPLGRKTQSLTIEAQRRLKIINTDCDDSNSGFQWPTPLGG